jgi:hypothetical protein
MLRKIYLVFGTGVVVTYMAASWMGWEMASSGQRSVFGRVPFISGYRGGK